MIGAKDRAGLGGDPGGVFERCAFGGLHQRHEVALIFIGDEAGGDALVDPPGGGKADQEDGEDEL